MGTYPSGGVEMAQNDKYIVEFCSAIKSTTLLYIVAKRCLTSIFYTHLITKYMYSRI